MPASVSAYVPMLMLNAISRSQEQSKPSGCGQTFKFGCIGLLGFILLLAIIGKFTGGGNGGSGGGAVVQSAWDGSVRQVKQYLQENLKDPDSLQFIEWSPVEHVASGYAVRCKYRAKNSFGGYVTANKIFVMDNSGQVIGTKDP